MGEIRLCRRHRMDDRAKFHDLPILAPAARRYELGLSIFARLPVRIWNLNAFIDEFWRLPLINLAILGQVAFASVLAWLVKKSCGNVAEFEERIHGGRYCQSYIPPR